MSKVTVVGTNNMPRIEYVPKRPSVFPHKVQPVGIQEEYPATTITNEFSHDSPESDFSKASTTNHSSVQNTDDGHYKAKSDRLSLLNINKSPPLSPDNISNLKQIKDSNHGSSSCFSRLTSAQKIICKLIIATLVILVIAAAVVLPVYFFILRQTTQSQSSSANVSVSACSAYTCIGKEVPYRSSIVTALYTFDGNMNDQTGYATGTAYGTSVPTATGSGYLGPALTLTSSSAQYVQIPNINLSKQSFTLEAWIVPILPGPANDYAMFGQCDSNGICISFSIRNSHLAFSLDSMNINNITLIGSFVILSNWFHVAAVYDATLFQQRIYVNGKIDAVSNGIVNPYQGVSSSATTTIGKSSSLAYTTSYFNGRLDFFTISAGVARSSCQLLNDASLVVYYPFDTNATFNDYSVNICNGLASGVTAVSAGRVNQAISFPLNTSYFQSPCYPMMRANELAYSFSLWVNPTSTLGGGSLVHISGTTNGTTYCYDVLAFTGAGNLVVQWMVPSLAVGSVQGPVIPANVWTHVAVVYLAANGVRLFINGQLSAFSPNTATLNLYNTNAAIYPLYITLGNIGALGPYGSVTCQNGSIPITSGSYTGSIDEFRLYNRELDSQELCVLANP